MTPCLKTKKHKHICATRSYYNNNYSSNKTEKKKIKDKSVNSSMLYFMVELARKNV